MLSAKLEDEFDSLKTARLVSLDAEAGELRRLERGLKSTMDMLAIYRTEVDNGGGLVMRERLDKLRRLATEGGEFIDHLRGLLEGTRAEFTSMCAYLCEERDAQPSAVFQRVESFIQAVRGVGY